MEILLGGQYQQLGRIILYSVSVSQRHGNLKVKTFPCAVTYEGTRKTKDRKFFEGHGAGASTW